ncbi:hypothetical protein DPF_1024 [Desulfoplanes formicivorans]|uniref:Uncharacterized protein n=1 Tax=Desulfoplanes formicivorans TaxID=1592317 RepID=A0A194AG66_9BACT|nr:hypothetical protein DPF_1024 [Desulfoplanes formicivorans]
MRVGFMQGTAISWQCEIHDLHAMHSFDTPGQSHCHVVIETTDSSLARGTVLVWGLAAEPADKTHDPL